MDKKADKNTVLISLKEGVDPRSVLPANVMTRNNNESIGTMGIKIQRLHNIEPVVKKARSAAPSSLEANMNDEKVFENEYKNMGDAEKKLYRTYEVKVDENVDLEKLLDELRKNDGVEHAELNYLNSLHEKPNDIHYDELYGLKNMQCEKVWDITMGEDVVVAVLDTGVDYNHPDMKENMWKDENGRYGYDFSDDDEDSMDYDLHGTHVAGTIAAVGNNGMGVIGVAPKVKIMALKVFPQAFDSVLARALKYAVDNGARIISNSWGPRSRRPRNLIVEQALDYVYEKGAIAVFSAGNENDETRYYSPANYSKTIAVGAVDANDKRAEFSNYDELVDVAAPGVDILSLKAHSDSYTNMDGTSMAAPHVSGLVALLLSKKPDLTFEQVMKILKESADEIQTDKYVGSGRVNAYKALSHSLMTGNVVEERELAGVR
ncbi:MAG: S8 family peptidase [Bacillota bacterium]